jgi:murein DD-endopeptidase MepM/ murein hydrolase activator NlpD
LLPQAFQKIALAANSSSTQGQQRIYRVQPGDTINRIVKKLQVSKADLIALNKINNSNIIFVNQQLKIPGAVTKAPVDDTSRSPLTKLASSKLTSKTKIPASPPKQNSVSPTAPKDPYIIKLKQEIDLLREQSIDPQSTNSVDLPTASQSLEKSVSEVDLDSVSQNNLNSELLKNQTIALRLPPLPPSEEYLPSAFDGYIWPAQGVLTSGYGWRWGRLHRGIDIAAPIGTPVLAAASGVVVGAGWHSGYGNLVKLKHLDGSVTLYGHTNKILVSHGQKVEQGQQIAEMGNTGYSTGSHLHFEIHPESEEAIDPLVLLGSR